MEKKYELTDEVIRVIDIEGRPSLLYRIKALRDFECKGTPVKAGDLGGFVESEDNLSHSGTCWIFDDAKVYDCAYVYGDACIIDLAEVGEDAKVSGSAVVADTAIVKGYSEVYDRAAVFDMACVSDVSVISEETCVYGKASVETSFVRGSSFVNGNAIVCNGAIVSGSANVRGDAIIYGDAGVYTNSDFIVFDIWWSDKNERYTWTRSNNKWNGWDGPITSEEMISKGYEDSPTSGWRFEQIVRYVNEIRAEEI